jgi:hypothetical protein
MATVTNVASSATSATVLAAGARAGVILCNSDANDCYVLLDDGTAAANNMSFILTAKSNAAVPKEYVNGEINAIWAADGSGYLHITVF